MAQRPILIFTKFSLESLNLDEAVFFYNVRLANITPLFSVECLADLEKAIKREAPQLQVSSLARRRPKLQSYAKPASSIY
jgi:hypothetical protein